MTSERFEFLRKVSLFADLTDPELELICEKVDEVHLAEGEVLFEEGSMGQHAYVIKDGQIEIYKSSNANRVHLAVRQTGEVIGEISLLETAPRNASGRALTSSVLLAISKDLLDYLLDNSPGATRTMLHTIIMRLQSSEIMLRQSEKMAQLGEFTAGIAHELNNPAAAVQRGTEQLKGAIAQLQKITGELRSQGISPDALLDRPIAGPDRRPVLLDPMTRSDKELEIEDWLTEQGIDNCWELAPQLVNMGYETSFLDGLAQRTPRANLPVMLRWVAAEFNVYDLLDEINQGAGRMAEIVKALKSYVYLDQAPTQEIDLHEGLDNTLVILRHKLKQGVEVVRDYDVTVPRILAYGSDLNQVWTNLIDNAIDAMDGSGRITLRTCYKDPWVVVEIEDNGPGIPLDVQRKLFSPFFTTKPVGKGTGLGLSLSKNIIRKHGGDITLDTQPGRTCFKVCLPAGEAARQADAVQPAKPECRESASPDGDASPGDVN